MVAEWRACRSRHCNVELSKRRRSIGYCATCKPDAVQLHHIQEQASLPDMLLAMLNNLQIGVVQPDIPTMHAALQTAVLHSLHNLSVCTTLSENGPRNIFSHVVTLSDLYHGAEKRSIPDVKLCCCCCWDVFCVLLCVVIVLKLCCCCCLMFVVCFLSLLL